MLETPFIQDITLAGKIKNYRECREVNKILKPLLPNGATKKQITEHLKITNDYELDCKSLKSAVKYNEEK